MKMYTNTFELYFFSKLKMRSCTLSTVFHGFQSLSFLKETLSGDTRRTSLLPSTNKPASSTAFKKRYFDFWDLYIMVHWPIMQQINQIVRKYLCIVFIHCKLKMYLKRSLFKLFHCTVHTYCTLYIQRVHI